MCGRMALVTDAEEVRRSFRLRETPAEALFEKRYNLAPMQQAPIVRIGQGGERVVRRARWGLVASWAKDERIGSRLINARAETAAEKPAFRSAFKGRRCVIPASGFYEWQAVEGERAKQPWWIHPSGGGLMAMAGLWERWGEGERMVETFTVLTTEANSWMRALHDRMPVILERDAVDVWLDSGCDPESLRELLHPAREGALERHLVSPRVNSARNDDASLIEPVEDDRLGFMRD